MSYIITDDKHYKDIAKSIRSKMQTDREYYPEDMAIAVDNIPSSADGTDSPVTGIYFLKPDDNRNPTKIKISGYNNPNGGITDIFHLENYKPYIKEIELINCDIKYLNDNIFNDLSSLTSVILHNGFKSIGAMAFQKCVSLVEINLPYGLIKIGDNAFDGCTSLTTINLPEGLNTIGNNAFNGCPALIKISIPKGVVSIGSLIFFNATSLSIVNLPDTLINIGHRAFYYVSSLKTINLPSSLEAIGTEIFNGCRNLKNVTLGNNFNCNGLNLSASTRYTRETILQWLNALADRTGQEAYKLTIGAKNLAKLTEEDILIATNKNWTLA